MEPVNLAGDQTSLPEQKLMQEIERLRIENAQLQKPPWLTPTVLVALGGLIISGLANVQQYVSAAKLESRAVAEQSMAEQRWSVEREKLEAEIAELQRKTAISSEDREAIQAELEGVNKDISSWEDAIFKLTFQLQTAQAELIEFESAKRAAKADAQRNMVQLLKSTLDVETRERDALIERRKELESRL